MESSRCLTANALILNGLVFRGEVIKKTTEDWSYHTLVSSWGYFSLMNFREIYGKSNPDPTPGAQNDA